MKKLKLSEIIVTDAYANTKPSEIKMNKYRDMWDCYNRQPKYITVNDNNVLIDGYIQYLLLKERGIEEAECIIRHNRNRKRFTYRNTRTTYVYGKHVNGGGKEYIWRIPDTWAGFAQNIKTGDKIFCYTEYGVAPVIVTKIETLNKCPVDIHVKNVVKTNKAVKRLNKQIEC